MKKLYIAAVMVLCATSLVAQNNETFVEIGGVKYRTVVMKDGNEWMAENLRYVPAGASVTPLATSYTAGENTGIFYPCSLTVTDGVATTTPTSDEAEIQKMGLLYTTEFVMGGALPTQDFVNAENTQGIAPQGWHVPTAQEWIDLVGACANSTHTNAEAPYYDQTLNGASLEALNADGLNLLPFPYVNQSKSYLTTYSNKRPDSPFNTYGSMAYFASSTGRSATQSYAAMITNNNTKTSVNVAYNMLTNGVFVRFCRKAEATAISNVKAEASAPVVYDLLGQAVRGEARGFYVAGGQKMLVK